MSRLAKIPVKLPAAVKSRLQDGVFTASNGKNELSYTLPASVAVEIADDLISFKGLETGQNARAELGTARANIVNMVTGLSTGYEKKLVLEGVGYRAQKTGAALELLLGLSHPVKMTPPEGIEVDVPSQTEIVIKGVDKQKVGQFAAEVRAWRPPEPYKGKGVRYADETILRKEAKKKA